MALNGLFVAAEFALVRIAPRRRSRRLPRRATRNADAVLEQIEQLDEYLSACQVGITMASIGIGFLGEPAVAELIEPLIEGPVGHGVATGISVAIAFTLVDRAPHLDRRAGAEDDRHHPGRAHGAAHGAPAATGSGSSRARSRWR